MPQAFPPEAVTTLALQLRAYLYLQYNDDQDLQAFWKSINDFGQGYLDSVNTLELPVYTSPTITGILLDWVALGIYGLRRPVLPSGQAIIVGPYDTWLFGDYAFNDSAIVGTNNVFETTDDIFKRIITWRFYKGDGKVFSIPWLKRRIMRFCYGANGTAPNIDNTYPVGIDIDSTGAGTITLTGVDPTIGAIFQAAVAGGAIGLPFQITWDVVLV